MSEAIIQISGLSKQYRLGQITGKRLADDLHRWWAQLRGKADPLAKIDETGSGEAPGRGRIWALKDVSFGVDRGEVLGIVGRNGAGKSTLLKILSRVTAPTLGEARVNGRIASLLEVGTGFHPELTGRENIFLNGAILGMTKQEIRGRFDKIVEFSEVGKFIDTPVKRYSSGMYVRLAFAVAAHLEPDILIVDEVLAVGDAAFQRKCLGKMKDVAGQGRTILFVSHNMAAITRLCRRALWLDQGELKETGDVEEIVAKYLAAGSEDTGEVIYGDDPARMPGSGHVRLQAVRLRGGDGRVTSALDIRRPFSIETEYRVLRRTANLRVGLRLMAHDGTVILSSTDMDGTEERVREPGCYVSRCHVPADFLNYGRYFVTIGCDSPGTETHFLVEQALAFCIEQVGGIGGHINDGRTGILRMRLPWEVAPLEE